ncbi:hypothetical protein GCM10009630_56780 [Kribbella jejuensis]
MATNNGTLSVAAYVALLCSLRVTVSVALRPIVLRPVNITDPTWYFEIAEYVAVPGPVAAPPTMNNCPTRCANVIRAKTVDAPPAAEAVPVVPTTSASANNQAPSRTLLIPH